MKPWRRMGRSVGVEDELKAMSESNWRNGDSHCQVSSHLARLGLSLPRRETDLELVLFLLLL